MNIKVRIAPSPTGLLHIGTARTALFNWLFAKHNGGKFVLRIEDTDLERSEKKYETDIIEGLKWLGIDWDGEIYRQSERLGVYKKHLQQLLDSGAAFWCHHTPEELAQEKERQTKNKEPQRHLCDHKETAQAKTPGGIIRLSVPWDSTRKIGFTDIIRGSIDVEERLLGDLSLAKDLDTPLYNFAVVIDDLEMKISHVIRGEDHISNTPKQLLIYSALGAKAPQFAHLPLILAPDRSKLSKRHGAVSVNEYKKDYLPAALANFMAFIGYTYSEEILTMNEMAKEFELEKVHKSGAVFDAKKLNWLNAQYARKLSPAEFKKYSGAEELPDAAVPLVLERLEKFSDIQQFRYFWEAPEYQKDLLQWKDSTPEKLLESLRLVRDIADGCGWKAKDELRKRLDDLSGPENLNNRGLVYWPFRVALTGAKTSPDPVDVAFALGKKETLKRIDIAIQKLDNVK